MSDHFFWSSSGRPSICALVFGLFLFGYELITDLALLIGVRDLCEYLGVSVCLEAILRASVCHNTGTHYLGVSRGD